MTLNAPEGLQADLSRCALGGVGLARARSSRARIHRVADEALGRNLVLHILHRGTLVLTHGDQSSTSRPGEIIVADDAQPYTIDISQSNDCLILQVPIGMMGSAFTQQDWHGRLFDANNPNVLLLGHMLRGIWSQREHFDDLDDEAGALLADAARMVCRHKPVAQPSRSPVEYALENLCDADLGTAAIGQALNMSSRAVQKSFFRNVGLTPTAFITTRRLERAAALLARDGGQTITDIAFEVGFNDSAFFTRCFRRQFGSSPRKWRRDGCA